MKKILIILLAIAFNVFAQGEGDRIVNPFWKLSSGVLSPTVSTWTLTLPATTFSPSIIVQGLTANDLPTYSAEFLLSTGWTSTDWTGDFATGWTHTVGNISVLSQSKVAVNATKYQIAYTVTGRTAGSFTIGFGGQSIGATATGAFGPTTTSTASLTITPTTDFDGTIVISIKSITAISTPLVNLKSSEGTARIEMRANAASGNTFIGIGVGSYNTTGYGNTTNGYASLYANTTGYNNTTNGMNSLYANTTGYSNTANGYASLYANTTGYNNTTNGMYSLYANTTGGNNTANGYQAGRYIADGTTGRTTGNNGIYFGYNAKASADGTDNEIVIGYNAIGAGSNTVTLGNTSVTKTILNGNIGIGVTTFPTTLAKGLTIANGTAPTVKANSASLYVVLGEMWVYDSTGTATQISPHNKDGDWVFNSYDVETGERTYINMITLAETVEELSGKTIIMRDNVLHEVQKKDAYEEYDSTITISKKVTEDEATSLVIDTVYSEIADTTQLVEYYTYDDKAKKVEKKTKYKIDKVLNYVSEWKIKDGYKLNETSGDFEKTTSTKKAKRLKSNAKIKDMMSNCARVTHQRNMMSNCVRVTHQTICIVHRLVH